MAIYQNPEMLGLFAAYAGAPDSITVKLAAAVAARSRNDPFIVATPADVALYPGEGGPPVVQPIRLSTRGFKELAAVSHLGTAIASLVQMRAMGASWRDDARRLLSRTEAARAANTAELWQNRIRVEAFRGREQDIADMIDYTCRVSERYLRRALAEESYLRAETLRGDYLEAAPIPVNQVMVATFFLVGMDIGYRFLGWPAWPDLAWDRAMVMIVGQHGRVTSGVTWNTNSLATLIRGVSGGRLPMDRMYIAPHAPAFPTPVDGDLGDAIALETPLRQIWNHNRASIELGETMFSGYPRFAPGEWSAPDLDDGLTEVTDMPVIHAPDDWPALVTRLRVVLEDPRQMVSSAVIDYAMEQLVRTGNDPSKVTVPGLTGIPYSGAAVA